jgi:sugar/nucleoside kinase (ribokinase family)
LTEEEKLRDNLVLSSKAFHYLASPADLKPRILKLIAIRAQMGISRRPLIIWEPSPLTSNPDNLQSCLEVAKLVDVFSPNHLELAATFRVSYSKETQKSEIETLALEVLSSGVGPDGNGVVVIRAGENGCLVQSRDVDPKWLPPFYVAAVGENQASGVVDPTGAGNAFLGAYSIGYLETGDVIEAAYYGSVAASFALEQVGMPRKNNEGKDSEELWNGARVRERLDQYKDRQESTN